MDCTVLLVRFQPEAEAGFGATPLQPGLSFVYSPDQEVLDVLEVLGGLEGLAGLAEVRPGKHRGQGIGV